MAEKEKKSLQKNLYAAVKAYYEKKYGAFADDVQVERERMGKPYITVWGEKPPDFFNLSHSSGAGAVIFSDCEVGLDIEILGKADAKVAENFFHKNEQKYLKESRDEAEYQRRFYEIWTKKEAYLKWNGTGLMGGLADFDVLTKQYAFQYVKINGKTYALSVYGGRASLGAQASVMRVMPVWRAETDSARY